MTNKTLMNAANALDKAHFDKRITDDEFIAINNALGRLADYESCGLSPNQARYIAGVLKQLANNGLKENMED